jgi:hypothetical protein
MIKGNIKIIHVNRDRPLYSNDMEFPDITSANTYIASLITNPFFNIGDIFFITNNVERIWFEPK